MDYLSNLLLNRLPFVLDTPDGPIAFGVDIDGPQDKLASHGNIFIVPQRLNDTPHNLHLCIVVGV